jgi:hypothetical protein
VAEVRVPAVWVAAILRSGQRPLILALLEWEVAMAAREIGMVLWVFEVAWRWFVVLAPAIGLVVLAVAPSLLFGVEIRDRDFLPRCRSACDTLSPVDGLSLSGTRIFRVVDRRVGPMVLAVVEPRAPVIPPSGQQFLMPAAGRGPCRVAMLLQWFVILAPATGLVAPSFLFGFVVRGRGLLPRCRAAIESLSICGGLSLNDTARTFRVVGPADCDWERVMKCRGCFVFLVVLVWD